MNKNIEVSYRAERDEIIESNSQSFESIDHVQTWIASLRKDGWDVSAWDDNGNDF